MTRYIIEFDREKCIGAGSCVGVCPSNWTMHADGKANILEKEIDEESLLCNKEAAAACPVSAIRILEKKTGEELL